VNSGYEPCVLYVEPNYSKEKSHPAAAGTVKAEMLDDAEVAAQEDYEDDDDDVMKSTSTNGHHHRNHSDPTGFRAYSDLDRLVNEVGVTFNVIDTKPEEKREIRVSKQITFGQLRRDIAASLNMEPDSFRMFKPAMSSYSSRMELIDEDRKIYTEYYSRPVEVYLEKGKPTRKGEIKVQFNYVDLLRSFTLFERPNPDAMTVLPAGPPLEYDGSKYSLPLFALVIKEGTPISDVKVMFLAELDRLRATDGGKILDSLPLRDVSQMRLRGATWSDQIDSPLEDGKGLECNFTYRNEITVFIEYLDPARTATSSKRFDKLVIMQQFKPSTWTLGEKFEMAIDSSARLSEVLSMISERTGIVKVTVAKDEWDGKTNLNKLPLIEWGCRNEDGELKTGLYLRRIPETATVHVFHLHEGDIVYFADATEVLAPLSEDDKKAQATMMQQRALAIQRAKGKVNARDREGGVRIKQKELDV
jgi:hypothetical protein